MNEKDFVAKRKADWDRLVSLIDACELGISNLKGDQIKEFGKLYRRVAGDLALVRTQSANQSMEAFLNDLVARGHGVLYRHPKRSFIVGVSSFLREAASAVRRRKVYVFAAIGFTIFSAMFAGSAIRKDATLLDTVLPSGFEAALEHWKSKEFRDASGESALQMTGFYIANNTMATVMVAAGGVTFGLTSLYSLFVNGAMLGAFTIEMDKVDGLGHFYSGIAAHGVTELGGIFIGGAAGLLMGFALVNPGRRTRGQALRKAGRDAMYLIGIGILMIWIAAPIEGFISFTNSVPTFAKLAIAFATLVGWLFYFGFVGRDLDENRRLESA
ncbi:MAG: stage II sporulation protein M [Fimbriimonadales bacterium]|nr:stage II sporulation protein M [Fimbriimonadales bacterium]